MSGTRPGEANILIVTNAVQAAAGSEAAAGTALADNGDRRTGNRSRDTCAAVTLAQ